MLTAGNCRVYLNGKIILGPKDSCQLSCLILFILLLRFSLITCVYYELFSQQGFSFYLLIPCCLHYLFIFYNSYCFFKGLTTDPGILPRENPPVLQEGQNPVSYLDYTTDDKTFPIKWCYTCYFYKPPEVSHCSTCNNCVQDFDHHCAWLNLCVGRRNIKWFILILLTSPLSMLLDFVLDIYACIYMNTIINLSFTYIPWYTITNSVICILIFMVAFFLSIILDHYKQFIPMVLYSIAVCLIYVYICISVNQFIYFIPATVDICISLPFFIWLCSFLYSTLSLYAINKTIKENIRENEKKVHKTSKHVHFKELVQKAIDIIKLPYVPPYTDYKHNQNIKDNCTCDTTSIDIESECLYDKTHQDITNNHEKNHSTLDSPKISENQKQLLDPSLSIYMNEPNRPFKLLPPGSFTVPQNATIL